MEEHQEGQKERRKIVGRRIKRERRRAGHRSQKAFAEAIGVHETSVAYAETGNDRIGDTVFGAIEDGLNWPEDSIQRYLDTGDLAVFTPEPAPVSTPDPLQDPTYLRQRRRLQELRKEHGERAGLLLFIREMQAESANADKT